MIIAPILHLSNDLPNIVGTSYPSPYIINPMNKMGSCIRHHVLNNNNNK